MPQKALKFRVDPTRDCATMPNILKVRHFLNQSSILKSGKKSNSTLKIGIERVKISSGCYCISVNTNARDGFGLWKPSVRYFEGIKNEAV
jgi:hypothetical protein